VNTDAGAQVPYGTASGGGFNETGTMYEPVVQNWISSSLRFLIHAKAGQRKCVERCAGVPAYYTDGPIREKSNGSEEFLWSYHYQVEDLPKGTI
jgi:hypothetical protein